MQVLLHDPVRMLYISQRQQGYSEYQITTTFFMYHELFYFFAYFKNAVVSLTL